MQDFHGYCISFSGVLLFGFLQGVCVGLADTVKVLKVGSSLDLPFQYPIESVLLVQWTFNKNIFAEYSTDQNYTLLESQFSGRLKEHYDRVGVTVQDLQHQDSGTFSVAAVSIKPQYQTQIFKVYVQSPIKAVQIEKYQTWLVSTNSCDVDVKCAALGSESVSYLWSGYKTAHGAQLQFSLSPAEGAVTLNCTAANNVSSSSATETLSCSPEQPEPVLKLVSSLVAASPYLLVTIILGVKCYRARGHHNSQYAVEE
ncbi:SLAM family member 8-like isoform X4 [Pangasianodon hypophthalmus]|uniref:SLAM family member 8-like isoform X4 n=1 Tax=Pangasianodon hypophthalmus TaxID=310915 RepID=UPI0023072317|nr:SLAM family member 8-like isoform X4 [Pangasianodon hypophthalmus]